jgi:hypothetical protein
MNRSEAAHLEGLLELVHKVDEVSRAADEVRDQITSDMVAARLRERVTTTDPRRRREGRKQARSKRR